MSNSGQKFIQRNKAPRVQIEYDLERYGSTQKVTLPFIIGVMADLSGKPAEALPPVNERPMTGINTENFDEVLKGARPRIAFSVPNRLSEQGNMSVELQFECLADFSPAAVCRKVEPLRQLLEARTQLANLLTYMDGKSGAEGMIQRLLSDPAQLRALTHPSGSETSSK